MPTGNLSPEPDVPACDRCGAEATFNDADGLPVCEFCPAIGAGIDWGRSSAYVELAVAILTACAATGTEASRLHRLVEHAADSEAVELPLAPPDDDKPDAIDGSRWLDGLTPITGRGEAIVAARRKGGQ
jgi:hypothetical protein